MAERVETVKKQSYMLHSLAGFTSEKDVLNTFKFNQFND